MHSSLFYCHGYSNSDFPDLKNPSCGHCIAVQRETSGHHRAGQDRAGGGEARGSLRLPGELLPADGAGVGVPKLHLLPVGGGAGVQQRRAGGGVPAERVDPAHREPRGDGGAGPEGRADQHRARPPRRRAGDGGGAGGRPARRRRAGRVRGRAERARGAAGDGQRRARAARRERHLRDAQGHGGPGAREPRGPRAQQAAADAGGLTARGGGLVVVFYTYVCVGEGNGWYVSVRSDPGEEVGVGRKKQMGVLRFPCFMMMIYE